MPVWRLTRERTDDLWLSFDAWGTSAQGANASHTLTMRNEISAVANKVNPNGASWTIISPTGGSPGVVRGQGHRLGVVNQGFVNDGNHVYDFNPWLQPVGEAASCPNLPPLQPHWASSPSPPRT